jgi:hypothetical protein
MSHLSCPWAQQLYCIWTLHSPGRPKTTAVLGNMIKWTLYISYEMWGFIFAVSSQRMDAGTSFWNELISCFKVLPLYSLVEYMESIGYGGNLGEIRTAYVPNNIRSLPLQESNRSLNLAGREGLRVLFREWIVIHVKLQRYATKCVKDLPFMWPCVVINFL